MYRKGSAVVIVDPTGRHRWLTVCGSCDGGRRIGNREPRTQQMTSTQRTTHVCADCSGWGAVDPIHQLTSRRT